MNCKIRLNIYLYKQTNKTKDSVKTKKKKTEQQNPQLTFHFHPSLG